MKLIVTGATGFIGAEVLRQALRNPNITCVVAFTRRSVSCPDDAGPAANQAKFCSVVLTDWLSPYPDSVMEHLQGADGCVW